MEPNSNQIFRLSGLYIAELSMHPYHSNIHHYVDISMFLKFRYDQIMSIYIHTHTQNRQKLKMAENFHIKLCYKKKNTVYRTAVRTFVTPKKSSCTAIQYISVYILYFLFSFSLITVCAYSCILYSYTSSQY